jgi:hypothetical protein
MNGQLPAAQQDDYPFEGQTTSVAWPPSKTTTCPSPKALGNSTRRVMLVERTTSSVES